MCHLRNTKYAFVCWMLLGPSILEGIAVFHDARSCQPKPEQPSLSNPISVQLARMDSTFSWSPSYGRARTLQMALRNCITMVWFIVTQTHSHSAFQGGELRWVGRLLKLLLLATLSSLVTIRRLLRKIRHTTEVFPFIISEARPPRKGKPRPNS